MSAAAKRKRHDDDDRDLGLWVDTGFFRKLTTRPPQTIIHGSAPSEDNYYLHLADVALRNNSHNDDKPTRSKPAPKSRKRKARQKKQAR